MDTTLPNPDMFNPADFHLKLWEHYQNALDSNFYQDPSILQIIRNGEQYHREKYLECTQSDEAVLISAGFSVRDDQNFLSNR